MDAHESDTTHDTHNTRETLTTSEGAGEAIDLTRLTSLFSATQHHTAADQTPSDPNTSYSNASYPSASYPSASYSIASYSNASDANPPHTIASASTINTHHSHDDTETEADIRPSEEIDDASFSHAFVEPLPKRMRGDGDLMQMAAVIHGLGDGHGHSDRDRDRDADADADADSLVAVASVDGNHGANDDENEDGNHDGNAGLINVAHLTSEVDLQHSATLGASEIGGSHSLNGANAVGRSAVGTHATPLRASSRVPNRRSSLTPITPPIHLSPALDHYDTIVDYHDLEPTPSPEKYIYFVNHALLSQERVTFIPAFTMLRRLLRHHKSYTLAYIDSITLVCVDLCKSRDRNISKHAMVTVREIAHSYPERMDWNLIVNDLIERCTYTSKQIRDLALEILEYVITISEESMKAAVGYLRSKVKKIVSIISHCIQHFIATEGPRVRDHPNIHDILFATAELLDDVSTTFVDDGRQIISRLWDSFGDKTSLADFIGQSMLPEDCRASLLSSLEAIERPVPESLNMSGDLDNSRDSEGHRFLKEVTSFGDGQYDRSEHEGQIMEAPATEANDPTAITSQGADAPHHSENGESQQQSHDQLHMQLETQAEAHGLVQSQADSSAGAQETSANLDTFLSAEHEFANILATELPTTQIKATHTNTVSSAASAEPETDLSTS